MEETYKNYKIVPAGGFGMKEIKPIGKGSVPKELRGTYTTMFMAKRAIDLHVPKGKVNKNGETE